MVATSSKRKASGRDSFSENIFIRSSDDAQLPAGHDYRVVKSRNQWFVFNKNGDRVQLDEKKMEWEPRDRVVMIVRANSSMLEGIEPGKIYRVYDDERQDERYVKSDQNEKVLFDKNIFKWEVL